MNKRTIELAGALVEVNPQSFTWSEVVDDAKALIRASDELNRINERRCNEEMSDIATLAMERAEAKWEERAARILRGYGIAPAFSGDPRGFPIKFPAPETWPYRDWAGVGFIPTRSEP